MPETAGRRERAPGGRHAPLDQAVQGYIDAISAEHRPLFDRLHRLILQVARTALEP